ncbi:hypothetical protein LEP1GSC127_2214 [Leptospira kirschneri str. 200801925]|nr:hypothetical protein LEP1GSC127_2214 [Leptospira kirschneri str. 200801925]
MEISGSSHIKKLICKVQIPIFFRIVSFLLRIHATKEY